MRIDADMKCIYSISLQSLQQFLFTWSLIEVLGFSLLNCWFYLTYFSFVYFVFGLWVEVAVQALSYHDEVVHFTIGQGKINPQSLVQGIT